MLSTFDQNAKSIASHNSVVGVPNVEVDGRVSLPDLPSLR